MPVSERGQVLKGGRYAQIRLGVGSATCGRGRRIPVSCGGPRYLLPPLCCTYPPVTGTTHIVSVSPQVALPGATVVYIQGYCFGDSKGRGSITFNGEPITDIVFWTDSEITPTDLTVGLQPGGGQMVTECEPYPNTNKGKRR